MSATLDGGAGGNLTRKAGIMGIVLRRGHVRREDTARIELPRPPHLRPDRV